MTPRRAGAALFYNGSDLKAVLDADLISATYTDEAEGSSDTASITLSDRDRRWLNGWHMQDGDRFSLQLFTVDWQKEDDKKSLDCGSFAVDDFAFSGPPMRVKLGGVSAPRDNAFSDTERTKTWEQVTLQEIAQEIAGRYALTLVYDAPELTVKATEQAGTADSDFLESLCETWGLCLKVYDNRLVVYDREQYKAKGPVREITPEELNGAFSYAARVSGVYTGAKLAYTDPKTGEDITAEYGSGPRWLALNEQADDATAARQICQSRLAEENHDAVTMQVEIPGDLALAAAQTVQLTGFGSQADGKYFINTITHSIGSRFVSRLELCKVVG